MIKLVKIRNICKIKKVFIMIFLFSFIFLGLNPVTPGNMLQTEKIGENLLISPLTAEVHDPIFIVGNTELIAFCADNGKDGLSWATAYVIKDYEIDAGASGSVIEISDTTLYLIIQNCTVTNSGSAGIDAGISLDNCMNVKITECNVSNNNNGLYLFNSNNNSISGNLVSDNNYGIILYLNCDNNTLSENDVSYNTWSGIYLETGCNYNTISGNNVSYNFRGLYFEENIEDNTIWMNYISNNSNFQGESDISSNWDNGTLGNYWGDFREKYPDATSSNGIWWDWEYEVDPGYNDTRPLVHPGFPEISSSANIDYMIGDEGNEISWTISDSTILDSTFWIYLDGVEIQTGSWNSGSIFSINVDGLSIGTYNYVLKCNDGTAWGWIESQIAVNVAEIPKPVLITTSQTISTENITVEWSEVVGVDSYNVYVNGTLTYSTVNLTQNIWLNETGTYSIAVTAIYGAEESEHSDTITIIVLLDDSKNNIFWYFFAGGWLLVAAFIGIAIVKVKMKK